MKTSKYNIIVKYFNKDKESLVYNTVTGSVLRLNMIDIRILEDEKFSKFSNDKLDYLIKQGIIVDSSDDELQKVINENRTIINESNLINYSIAPSSNCQLGCDYCGQEHSSNTLNVKWEKLIIERLERLTLKNNAERLHITWYGGEPLIGIKSIIRLNNEIRKIDNLKFISQSMITNGILLNVNRFSNLTELGINSFQITIDGDEEVHNARRPSKNKANSFKLIYNNLKAIISSSIFDVEQHEIAIRINIDKRNLLSVKNLLTKFANDGLQTKLRISFAPVHSWENEVQELIEDKATIAETEIELFILMKKLGFDVDLFPKRLNNVCIMTSKVGELVDAFGNIYNCTEAPYTPAIKDDSKYLIGQLENETISENNHLSDWFSIVEKGEQVPCTNCELLPVCGGACPKKWIDDKESPCPTFKFNIKDRLVLHSIKNFIE